MKNKIANFIVFLFHFLLFSTPFVFTWVNEELFEFPKMLFVYAMAILIASTWVIRMIIEKRVIFKRSKLDYFLFFFLASQLISTVISIHPQTSIFGYYSRLHGGLLSTISYLTLYFAFVSNINKKQLQYFFYTFLSSALLVSLYAIPEHFGGSISCFLMLNEFNVSCWKQDVMNRVFASFGQPNWLAAYSVTLIPLLSSLFLLKNKAAKYLPLLALLASAALFIVLLFTKSRSGFIAFIISMGFYFIGLRYLNLKKNIVVSKSQLLTLIFSFAIAALTFGTTYTSSLKEILSPKNNQVQETKLAITEMGGTDSGAIRKIVWRGSLDMGKRYPLFGSGVETFAYAYYQDRPEAHNLVSEWDFLYNKAHNEFLNFLATTGLVGLTAYLLVIFGFLSLALKTLVKERQNQQKSLIILGLVSGYIALAVSNFFGFSTVYVSLLFFLYPAFFIVLISEKSLVSKNFSSLKLKQVFLIIITLAIACFLLLSILTKWLADYQFAKAKNYINDGYTAEGIKLINSAISLSPNEALFYNQLSIASGRLAINLAQESEPQEELIAQFVEQALLASEITLSLNPVHNNFYKTRGRLFITLSQLNPEFLLEAKSTLKQAILLAPTDAKLYYYLGTVEISLEETKAGISTLEKTTELKPNYGSARITLAEQYELQEDFAKAKEQYQYILDNINPEDSAVKEKLEQLEK